eukprot:jgi/Picre1/33246/NNA_008570.t1
MAAAETGSGKTGAFCLPVVQIVHERLRSRCLTEAEDTDEVPTACVLSAQDRSSIEGKAYFEITVEDEGLCRVGWATRHGSLDIGTDTQSFGYGGTGKKSHGKKFEDYGESFGLHDVIGCWVDLSAKTLGFTKNGRNLGYPDGCGPICDVCLLTNPLETSNTKATTDAVSQKLPVALILEPVRDLAQQTKDVMENFARHLTDPAVPVSLLIGGESAAAQIKSIQAGAAIIVGTPGRVADLVQQGKLDISGVKFFVLDEADALLEAGHRDVILSLFRKVGTSGTGMNRLQTLLFSATLHSPHVMRLANELCQNVAFIDLKGMNALPDAVDHALVMADPEEDRTWLQSTPRVWTDRMHDVDPPLAPNSSGAEAWSCAVKCLKPRLLQRLIHGLDIQQALIFCRTNFDCENLEAFMNEIDKGVEESPDKSSVGDKRKRSSRYSCAVLAGARSMDDRRAALDAFKAGTIRYLIATDVAARGIDVSGLPFVINMTLPDRCEDYVHRSGRVGRADTPGLCISIVSSVPEKVWFCRKKGLKPWLNPTKENTSTKKGGHAIWLQEKLLLRDIEERLGTGIVPLQSDMSLPPSLLGSRYGKGGQPKTEADAIALEVAARVEASRESVKKLAQLEHEAQQTFFKLQSLGWSRS